METAQFSCIYFIIESCLYSEEEGNTQLYSAARIQPNLLTTVGEGLVNGRSSNYNAPPPSNAPRFQSKYRNVKNLMGHENDNS